MSYASAKNKSKEILRRIVASAKATTPAAPSTKEIPEAIKELVDASSYSDRTKSLFIELFSEILGKETPATEPATSTRGLSRTDAVVVETGYEAGMVVVPLTNPNSHNYALGEPVLILTSGSASPVAYRKDGTIGNYLPGASMYPEAVRLADEGEIDSFYDTLAASGAILAFPS